MVLNIFALAFILGITVMQSVFGLFSGVIMVVCSLVAAVVALGLFDVLNDLASQYVHPSYAAPGVLVVSFVLTLVVLRVLADNLIRGNVRVPAYVDWGGGAVCGFISAMICVGVMMLGVVMLPLGGRVMMYTRYVPTDQRTADGRPEFRRSNIWLNPDGFTASLVSRLSAGALRPGKGPTFGEVYPDFPAWVWRTGNTIQSDTLTAPTRDKGDGFRAVRVASWWEHKGSLEARYRTKAPTRSFEAEYEARTYRPEAGMRLIGARLELGDAAADRDERRARHRFRPTMIRVVGEVNGRPADYVAQIIGGADPKAGGPLRIADLDSNFSVKDENSPTTTIDCYFEVDQDFTPRFLEYRRFARAPLTAENRVEVPPAGLPASGGAPSGGDGSADAGGGRGEQRASGISRFVDIVDLSQSGDREELPVPLNRNAVSSAGDAEFDGETLKSGRVFGDVSALRGAGPTTIRRLKPPEGFRICQVRYSPKQAHSIFGRVFNFAARTLNQYFAVERDTQTRHRLSGYYAIVPRGGQPYIELYYTGEKEPLAYNGMLDFKEIRPQELTENDDAVLGLIFIVPPGVVIDKIENQVGAGVEGLGMRIGG